MLKFPGCYSSLERLFGIVLEVMNDRSCKTAPLSWSALGWSWWTWRLFGVRLASIYGTLKFNIGNPKMRPYLNPEIYLQTHHLVLLEREIRFLVSKRMSRSLKVLVNETPIRWFLVQQKSIMWAVNCSVYLVHIRGSKSYPFHTRIS